MLDIKNVSIADLRWLTINEATTYYRCGDDTLMRIAKEAGALVNLGRGERAIYRVDRAKVDRYLEQLCQ